MKGAAMDDTTAMSPLLRCYAALDAASQEMLDAARAGDWDHVCRLEGACAVLVTQLRETCVPDGLPTHEQAERSRILRRIVRRDAEVRRLCEPVPDFLDSARCAFLPGTLTLH